MLRATIKSLLSRKLRLTLSGMAVVLGVMFVAGAFVLTDTLSRSFDSLFATAYQNVDVEVSTPKAADDATTTVPASVLAQARAVPGAASATGIVTTDGARLIGSNGKVVTTFGAPRFGTNWRDESDLMMLREGRIYQAPSERQPRRDGSPPHAARPGTQHRSKRAQAVE